MELSGANVAGTSNRSQGKKRKTREQNNDTEDAKPVKRTRRKWGLLKKLVQMPMDVLFEIFGHLDPLDLLQLARTTKALRAILMSRSSISVWRSARSNIVGLPDCPNDLSEAQYAALMFINKCSFCHKALSIIHISWYARIRCCNKCLKINFTQAAGYMSYQRNYPSLLADWLPFVKIVREKNSRRSGTSLQEIFFISETKDREWRVQYAALKDSNSQYEWLLRKLEAQYAIGKHARECALWHEAQQHNKSADKLQEIFERNAHIMNYIKEIGLEEDLYKHPPTDSDPLDAYAFEDLWMPPVAIEELCLLFEDTVLMPNTITGISLKISLTNKLRVSKHNREFAEYRAFLELRKDVLSTIYDNGIAKLPINLPYPRLAEVYHIAEDHDLMDYAKTAEYALRVPFDDVVALWRKHVDAKLIELISDACGSEYVFDPATVFDLATTVFVCPACNLAVYPNNFGPPLTHDQAMVHCCRTNHLFETTLFQRAFLTVFGYAPWRGTDTNVQFQQQILEVMQGVVEMCGLNPKVTTARQMDELDQIFECRTCNDVDMGRATMTWAAVLHHQRSSHQENPSDLHAMSILGEPDATTVRERIKEGQARATHQHIICKIVCPHCKDVLSNIKNYRKHLKERHQISKIKDEELIYSFQQDRIPPLYRLWPPLDEESVDDA